MLNRSRLHVGDLAPDVGEEDLRALFEQAGEIEDISLPLLPNGNHKGFAFIEMKTREGAEAAIKQFNGYPYHGHTLFVYSVPPRSPKRGESKAELR